MKRWALLSATLIVAFLTVTFAQSPQKRPALSISGSHLVLSGKSMQIISGAMHYPRIPREYWRDRLEKARAMGLNTIETYVFWNLHEPKPGVFDFSGNLDVAAYVRMAQEEGLHVIIRPGPYICSEWDFGGFPSWLFADPAMKVRTTDPRFLAASDEYLTRVGIELAPLQASRGGPIIMVQVENEYGSFGDDKQYMEHIRQTLIRAGFGESILYTADGPDRLNQGSLPGVLAVANFGPGEAKNAFAALEKFEPGKPLMNGEYWDGWFDSWGGQHHVTNAAEQASEFSWMLQQGYSVNLYMFDGGTTFGFMNGANMGSGQGASYQPQVTSYDYDAPVDEAGRLTKKYELFREAITRATHITPPDPPKPKPMISIPGFTFTESASLWKNLPASIQSEYPKTMEALGQSYGYILYRTEISRRQAGELVINGLHDYATVYLNQNPVGRLDRRLGQNQLEITTQSGHSTLDILVENLGRINYGPHLQDDRKGILGSVTLNGHELTGWEIYSLPMSDPANIKGWTSNPVAAPAFRRARFKLTSLGDTFLDVQNLGMGVAWVNGRNLGRDWNIGPQRSLFMPAPWLRNGENEVEVFDTIVTGAPAIRGVTQPVWKSAVLGEQ